MTAVAGIQTLPSTSTESEKALLGVGAVLMLIGALLMRRKPVTT